MVFRISPVDSRDGAAAAGSLPTATALFGPLTGLSPTERAQLEAVATGLNPLSRAAREALAPIISKPEFKALPPEVRYAKIRAVFNKSLAEVVSVYALELLKYQRGHATKIDTGVNVENYALGLRTMAKMNAVRIDITVQGVVVPVYQPASGQYSTARAAANLQNHSIEQVARALSLLTLSDLKRIKEIRLSPVPNPDDAAWSVAYHSKKFNSYMNAAGDGVVTIFPWKPSEEPFQAKEAAGTLMHELGHVATNGQWGRGTGAGRSLDWTEFAQAVKDDGFAVSTYAASSIEEAAGEADELRKLAFYATQYRDEFHALFPRQLMLLDRRFPLA